MNEKNKTIMIAAVLSLLIIISGVQAVQLQSIKNTFNDGGVISASSGNKVAAANTRTQELPANIRNLPTMVGGC